jgi:hypothetical protein
MINRGAMIWMSLAIAAGAGLFMLKYEVRAMEDHLVQIERQTMQNLETIHVLKAEWSHLIQPTRLEDLGRRLLFLEPTSAQQTASITDIPMRPGPASLDTASLDPMERNKIISEFSPAAGQGPPLLATYRRVQ